MVRIKKKSKQVEAPKELSGRERQVANLLPPWKPGQSGNPRGRPVGTGGVSIIKLIKKRLQGSPLFDDQGKLKGNPYTANGRLKEEFKTLADQLGFVLLNEATDGKIPAIQLIIDKTEPNQIDEEQLKVEIDRVFNVVCRHVRDPMILAAIARDLNLGEDS